MFTQTEKKIILLILGCLLVGFTSQLIAKKRVQTLDPLSPTPLVVEGKKVPLISEPSDSTASVQKLLPQDTSLPVSHSTTASVNSVPSTKININQANTAQLIQVKGIGPKTAQKIITYRKKHGPFKKIGDLIHVKGIGTKKLEKLRGVFSFLGDSVQISP